MKFIQQNSLNKYPIKRSYKIEQIYKYYIKKKSLITITSDL